MINCLSPTENFHWLYHLLLNLNIIMKLSNIHTGKKRQQLKLQFLRLIKHGHSLLLAGKTPVGCKWMCKVNYKYDETLERH